MQNRPYLLALIGQILFGFTLYGRNADILYYFTYVEGNAAVLSVMKHAFTTIPGSFWIVTAIVLFFYRLNKKYYDQIVEDLKSEKRI